MPEHNDACALCDCVFIGPQGLNGADCGWSTDGGILSA